MSGNMSNPILKAKSMPNSRRFAINAMCAQCMGCTETHIEPGFRKDIKGCASTACPLFAFRPYQDEDVVEEEFVSVEEAEKVGV